MNVETVCAQSLHSRVFIPNSPTAIIDMPHKRVLGFRNGDVVGLYQTQNLTDGQRIVVVFLFVHRFGVGLEGMWMLML